MSEETGKKMVDNDIVVSVVSMYLEVKEERKPKRKRHCFIHTLSANKPFQNYPKVRDIQFVQFIEN